MKEIIFMGFTENPRAWVPIMMHGVYSLLAQGSGTVVSEHPHELVLRGNDFGIL